MNTCKPYEKQSGSIFSTSKSDTLNHGFGLKNVPNTVEKYDGKLELKQKTVPFSAYVFLHNVSITRLYGYSLITIKQAATASRISA